MKLMCVSTAAPSFSLSPRVLANWSRFIAADISSIEMGLINLTLKLQTPEEQAILQRLHPVFSPQVNLDIAAITERLASYGFITPRLLPTDSGSFWVENEGIWRALSFVPGYCHSAMAHPSMAREAGNLVGRFHFALQDFAYTYQAPRRHVHDTKAHLQRLSVAVENHVQHRLHSKVGYLAEKILRETSNLADFSNLPLRHCHGDLKISNLMFDALGRGLTLIDLDTLAPMAWPLEMGDALRSWCNPLREDQRPARIDLDLLQAAVTGYHEATVGFITQSEWEALIPGLARICLELSARFLVDALNEQYFGWDSTRYPARGEHNLARGVAMLELYESVVAVQERAQDVIEKLMGAKSI